MGAVGANGLKVSASPGSSVMSPGGATTGAWISARAADAMRRGGTPPIASMSAMALGLPVVGDACGLALLRGQVVDPGPALFSLR